MDHFSSVSFSDRSQWSGRPLRYIHNLFLTSPGTRGKCIRTETSWMTPVEFVEEALGQTDTAWRRDIQWEGKPISELIMVTVFATMVSS